MDKIPLLDMKAQIAPIRKDIDKAIARVIDNGSFILGEEAKALEEEVCRFTGSKHSIGVSNGTDAITLSLEALGVGRGDRVICPSFTYYATAGAAARLGAIPVFVDIDPKTYCISVDTINSYFKRATSGERRATKSIIAVHLYGQCADMDPILELAREHDIMVIEDAAQAFGAAYKGKRAGTIGDCGTVSFFPGKNLGALGDAGMVLTNNSALAEKLRRLRNQGADPYNKYKHSYIGHNNRLDSIQAAVLRVKLKHLDEWNRKRAQNASYYNNGLKGMALKTPFVPETNTHIYHQYILRAENVTSRDIIKRRLQSKDIDCRVYYPIPLHLQECFIGLEYERDDMIESVRASEETFAIPVYPELTKNQQDYIIETIRESIKN